MRSGAVMNARAAVAATPIPAPVEHIGGARPRVAEPDPWWFAILLWPAGFLVVLWFCWLSPLWVTP